MDIVTFNYRRKLVFILSYILIFIGWVGGSDLRMDFFYLMLISLRLHPQKLLGYQDVRVVLLPKDDKQGLP